MLCFRALPFPGHLSLKVGKTPVSEGIRTPPADPDEAADEEQRALAEREAARDARVASLSQRNADLESESVALREEMEAKVDALRALESIIAQAATKERWLTSPGLHNSTHHERVLAQIDVMGLPRVPRPLHGGTHRGMCRLTRNAPAACVATGRVCVTVLHLRCCDSYHGYPCRS